MSISKVHELIQNKGCVWTVSVLMILSMVVGSFAMCGRANRFENFGNQNATSQVVAKVGETNITEALIQSELERGAAMYGGLSNLPASFQVQIEAGIIRSAVQNILQLQMAKKYGIEASDSDIEKIIREGVDQELAQFKSQLVSQKKLKPEATEAEFAAAFKKESGKDLGQLKDDAVSQNMEKIKASPDLRIPLASQAISAPLMSAIQKDIKLSDEELKQTFDTLEVKRIVLTKGNPDETAKKILDEIQKGSLTFEQAMDKYSEGTPEPKKKLSDKIDPLSRVSIRGFEAYRQLEELKPGEISKPIPIGPSVNLFKLIRIKSDLPKDFDKKKDTYRESQMATLAAQKLQADLQEQVKNVEVVWLSDAYKALYDFGRVATENLPSDERNKLQRQVLDESLKAATEGDPSQARLASSVAYVTFQNIYSTATPEEKKKLDEDKIKVYEAYLMDNEDAAMRLELVEVYKSQKKGAEFFNQLMAAANANLSQTDTIGQGVFSQINKYIKEGQDLKLISADEVKSLQDIQQQWIAQKADQDRMDAEAKKEEEAAKKAAEEDLKKANAEKAAKVKARETSSSKKPNSGG